MSIFVDTDGDLNYIFDHALTFEEMVAQYIAMSDEEFEQAYQTLEDLTEAWNVADECRGRHTVDMKRAGH